MAVTFGKILSDQRDLLLFRRFKPDLGGDNASRYLAWGLVSTWIVGIGRYWDHPSAQIWQYLGFGSVIYVFVLAAVLWAIASPLRPDNWTYRNVLLFVTLTSLPALLYAIPVEKFMSIGNAQLANVIFLAVVATWRIALLVIFLRRAGGLGATATAVACALPIVLIVTALTVLNLQNAVFDIMGGLREPTEHDAAYAIVVLISFFSVISSPVLFIIYVVQVNRRKALARLAERALLGGDPGMGKQSGDRP